MAQTAVTVRQINEIPQAQIDQLNTLADGVTNGDVQGCGSLIFNSLCGTEVTFTAVVMSDPLNSGLASVGSDGRPGRIHIFVRDVTADTEGPEGHGLQIVDGSNNLGFDGLVVGDVITLVGTVSPFNTTLQLSPSAAPVVVGSRDPASDPIFDPIVVTTSDLNASAGADGAIRVNWENLATYRNSYVRFEGATAVTRTSGSRVDWNWSSDGMTSVSMYDTSLRFRNDRSDYPDNYNARGSRDDFDAPVPGARVNVQGFVTFNGGTSSDPFSLGVPNGMALAVNPMADEDVVVTESPPTVASIAAAAVPSTTAGLVITATVSADPARNLTGASLEYSIIGGATASVPGVADSGGAYTFTVAGSAFSDGDFLTYTITATDDTGAITTTGSSSLRVLDDGINEIADIQTTSDGGPGSSPFAGGSYPVDIMATVQVDASTGFMTLQDKDGQDAWSGIVIERADDNAALVALNRGDVINLTQVSVEENFGVTRLDQNDITFTVVSTGGAVIAAKAVTTDILKDDAVAEAHEGMVLEIDDAIVVSTNADAPSGPFGEMLVSSDGTVENGVRVDDASDLYIIPDNADGREDPAERFSIWEKLDFVRGTLHYSFSNYKLLPADEGDIGAVINTGLISDELPSAVALHQNYPNPFNPTTSIRYEVTSSDLVQLEVFDMLGRRVRTLVNGHVGAGTHEVQLNAQNLGSGLYVYRLSVGDITKVRSMMLMK